MAILPLPEFVSAEGPAGPALVVSAGAAAVVDAAGAGEAEAYGSEPGRLFKTLGMPEAKETETPKGQKALFAVRHRA